MSQSTWHNLIRIDEIEKGEATPVRMANREYAVFDCDGVISVTSGLCTHGAARLADGYFDRCRIECPLHQGLFDCQTGQALAPPATRPLRVYPSRLQDGMIQIQLNKQF